MKVACITKTLFDPCLVAQKWLQVDFLDTTQETLAYQNSSSILEKYLQEAKQKKLPQISISVPVVWKHFQEELEEKGWQKSLTQFVLTPDQRKTVASQPSLLTITTKRPEIDELMLLLMQQAAYHSLRYPNYYRAPATIDMTLYQLLIENELKTKETITVCAYHDTTLVGFLHAEVFTDRVHTYELIVAPTVRGKGVGTELFSHFLQLDETKNLPVVLETWHDQPAQFLYKKFGFVETAQEYFFVL